MNYLSPSTIEDTADRVREMYDGTSAFTDVTKIALDNGIKVFEVEFTDSGIDGMIQTIEGDTTIYVNKHNPEVRKRFTIAHEIGHFVLHHDEVEKGFIVDYRQAIKNYRNEEELVRETQANMFAASLLLPKKELEKAWMRYHDIETVASLFQVSKKALMIRLDNLGLL